MDQTEHDDILAKLWKSTCDMNEECNRLRAERDDARTALINLRTECLQNEHGWKNEIIHLNTRFGIARDVYTIIMNRINQYYEKNYSHSFVKRINRNEYVPILNSHIEMQFHYMDRNSTIQSCIYPYSFHKISSRDMICTNIYTKKRQHICREKEFLPEFNIHYGSLSGVEVSEILKDLPDVDATEPIESIPSDLICEIANMFCKYGTGNKFNTEESRLFIKPAALNLWIQISQSRPELTKIRIVTHGTDTNTINLISKDAFGFSLCNAGKINGEIKGRGVYCSMGDDVSSSYSKDVPGTMLVILLLMTNNTDDDYGSWTKYPFGTLFDNVLVVHESCLMLILGKVVPLTSGLNEEMI